MTTFLQSLRFLRLRQLALALVLLFTPLLSLVQPTPALAASGPGTVVAWGNNDSGQLNIPVGLNDVTAIAAGWYHSLALKSDGTVVAWGDNGFGQLNIPAGLSGVTAIAGGGVHSLALKSDGTVVAWGYNSNGQSTIPAGLSGVTAIAGGLYHSLAIKSDGTVVAWGANGAGQLNIPAGLSGVTAIAGGLYHSLALKSDGTVVAWGFNGYGQSTIPAGLSDVTAIAAGWDHSLALKSDGTVVAWGYNSNGQSTIPAGLSGVMAIAGGIYHSLALKSDGTVVAWGANGAGQLNIPAGLSGVTAIAAGALHSLALAPSDTTAPVITPSIAGTLGSNGWYVSDVTVSWTVVDNESAISSQSGCDPVTVSADTASVTFTCSASSAGGSSSQSVTIQRDATPPVVNVTGVSDGATYTAGSIPPAGCSTSDATSDVATQATLNVSGGNSDGTGSFTVTCSGVLDNAGNGATLVSISYTVTAAPPPPLLQQVQTVRGNLAALLPSGDSKTDKALTKALRKIDQALAADLWQADGNHLTLTGDDVFNRLQDAVKELAKIKNPAPAVRTASSSLATLSRALAQLALDEAIAAGGDASKIAKAQGKLRKGDGEVANGKLDKAIAQYEDAWEYSQQALGRPVAAGLDPAADEPADDEASDPDEAAEEEATDPATLRNVIFLPQINR